MADERLIAVFIDYENLAIGVRQMRKGNFKIDLVLRRLLEKGRIVYKRAYCDWSGYRAAVREFHGHGVEMVDIPQTKASGKNSADIHMVVDALDLCYGKSHIDMFALLTGDSDFSPLVSKLKENGKPAGGGVINFDFNLPAHPLPNGLFVLFGDPDGLYAGNGYGAEIHLVVDKHPSIQPGMSWVNDLTTTNFPGMGPATNDSFAVFLACPGPACPAGVL